MSHKEGRRRFGALELRAWLFLFLTCPESSRTRNREISEEHHGQMRSGTCWSQTPGRTDSRPWVIFLRKTIGEDARQLEVRERLKTQGQRGQVRRGGLRCCRKTGRFRGDSRPESIRGSGRSRQGVQGAGRAAGPEAAWGEGGGARERSEDGRIWFCIFLSFS